MANDQDGNRRIIAIDPEWADPAVMNVLRQRCQDDRIRCPWCDAPVLIRAGEIVRRHFAHKRLEDCPYAHEDAEKLQGRQILYEWLITKVDKAAVELEAKVDGLKLPMPLDVMVSYADRQYGYCFLHRNIRELGKRNAICNVVNGDGGRGLRLYVVFSAQLFISVEYRADLVRLSPTQRELLTLSDYDKPNKGKGSLHFLDVESKMLTSLRGLMPFEGSQTFRIGQEWNSTISELCMRPSNGEIVHPGEHDALTAWEQDAIERKRRAEKQLKSMPKPEWWNHSRDCPAKQGACREAENQSGDSKSISQSRERIVPCEICGQLTPEEDQIVYSGMTKTCKCRVCMKLPARHSVNSSGEDG